MKLTEDGSDHVWIDKKCIFCNQEKTIKVKQQDYIDWTKGKLTQEAFPYLSPEDREILISGVCGPCFDKTFE